MRIGIDCRFFSSNFTGIGRYTHELVTHIIKLNNKLKTPHELVLFFNNPEYRRFKPPRNTRKVLADAKHYSLAEQTHFLFILNKEKLDLVHFPHFNVPILYSRPFTVTIHDLTLSLFPGQKMTRWYHRLAYHLTIRHATKKAKKILAVSRNTKRDLINHLKIPADKIEVTYIGVAPNFTLLQNPAKLKKTLKKYGITKQFLLYTGVWRSHKNLPTLIEAFKILRKKFDLQLVITGKPDPHYPEVKRAVKDLQLEDDVIFPGLVGETELVHLYNAAFIFVFPSLYEGFGLPPLESMACGTPVVASDRSSIPEVCGADNALFFDPDDPKDIARKIEKLYKDAGLQAELIDKGLRRAAQFSWEHTTRETFKIIQRCLNPSKNS